MTPLPIMDSLARLLPERGSAAQEPGLPACFSLNDQLAALPSRHTWEVPAGAAQLIRLRKLPTMIRKGERKQGLLLAGDPCCLPTVLGGSVDECPHPRGVCVRDPTGYPGLSLQGVDWREGLATLCSEWKEIAQGRGLDVQQ